MRFIGKVLLGVFVVVLTCAPYIHGHDDVEDGDVLIEEGSDAATEKEEIQLNKKPTYTKPTVKGYAYLADPFDSTADFSTRWVKSEAKKDDADEAIAKYDGEWKLEEPENSPIEGDLSLVLKTRAKHHAISTKLDRVYEFTGKPFVMQYEVKFQNGQDCGGAYVKLLTEDNFELRKFTDKMGYTIMFGPDKCGNDQKLHFIFRHKNPITGAFEEKHAKKPTASLDKYFTDKMTHLYTLVVSPDNTFEIYVDQELINSGSLLEDLNPPVNPPKEIVDPKDKKPEDWDEREKIPDPDASKPDDWDESLPEMIPDPAATKPDGWLDEEMELVPDPDAAMPADWDEDMDGEWEPPMIQNPLCESAPGCGEWEPAQIKNLAYKGKWKAPMIENPSYKGKWKPSKIENPEYFEDKEPYQMSPISALGLELWSMSDQIIFDNFLITDDKSVADDWASDTWEIKLKQERSGNSAARSVVDAIMDATNERPWLWAVFIVVIILPIVLVIAYCCMPGSSSKPDETRLHPKKTDKPTPDDQEESEESEGKEEVDQADSKQTDASGDKDEDVQSKATKAKKSDLEAEEEENEADNEDDGSKQNTRSSPKKKKVPTATLR